MTKIIFTILVSMTAAAGADSCQDFGGGWKPELLCQGIESYTHLRVGTFEGTQELILTFDRDGRPLPDQRYISDGIEHAGDRDNTGDTYTASCKGDTMTVRRVFKQLIYPIKQEFTLNRDHFAPVSVDLIEKFEGRDGATVCHFVR
ncbi:MAG: hypothetical protein ACXVA9_04655 [Bdellovibrionales bacterium]